jgi:hypothetical protein
MPVIVIAIYVVITLLTLIVLNELPQSCFLRSLHINLEVVERSKASHVLVEPFRLIYGSSHFHKQLNVELGCMLYVVYMLYAGCWMLDAGDSILCGVRVTGILLCPASLFGEWPIMLCSAPAPIKHSTHKQQQQHQEESSQIFKSCVKTLLTSPSPKDPQKFPKSSQVSTKICPLQFIAPFWRWFAMTT